MSAEGSTQVVMTALLANLGIAVAKFMGALFSGSAALFAEAIHSLVDCINQVLLLIGSHASKKPPTELHPLGFGREKFFWSFIVAILLFSLGGVFAIYEGIHKVLEPEVMTSPMVGLSILTLGLILEGISFRSCLHEIQSQNEFKNLWTWFRKSTSADLIVIFTEDLAAMVGLFLAAACIVLSWVTGDPIWDAYGSILVGSLLVCVALFLAIEIKSLIIGEAPSVDLRSGIQKILDEVIPGSQILKLIAIQTGSNEIMVSYKISPGSVKNVDELIELINEVEKKVKIRFQTIRWQFVEPDTKV